MLEEGTLNTGVNSFTSFMFIVTVAVPVVVSPVSVILKFHASHLFAFNNLSFIVNDPWIT